MATGEILAPPVNSKKIILFYAIISIIFLIFLSQIFYWQVVKSNYYNNLSAGRGSRIETIKAKRGLLFDRNLKSLVKNVSNFSLTVIPARFHQADNQAVLDAIKQYLSNDQQQAAE